MSEADRNDPLRDRLEALFDIRAERVRLERERREAVRRKRAAFVAAFVEQAQERVRPAFETAARTVDAHGFEGRVRDASTPEEGPPWIRFEMRPGDAKEDGPSLGRATLRYLADPPAERVLAERSVGGGDGDAFAQEGQESERLKLEDLTSARIDQDLAVLVARAIHVDDALG